MKKQLFALMSCFLVALLLPLTTYASEGVDLIHVDDGSVIGGWDEETGYFQNIEAYSKSLTSEIMPFSEVNHRGTREKDDSTSTTRYRAHGWTTWAGVYHYTRARMESSQGAVLTDSKRVWGYDGTEAVSPWWPFDPSINDKARTYYGSGN